MTGVSGTTPRSWVVKVGGREVAPGPSLEALARWVREQRDRGTSLVIVHGGGEEVTEWARRLDLGSEKVDGQRKTTEELLPLVQAVLLGPVQVRLLQALGAAGVEAFGTSGVGGGLVKAEFLDRARLGLVGRPTVVRGDWISGWLRQGLVPVLAPLAAGPEGRVLNVNADLFAGGLARTLKSPLLLITDVPGVRDAQGTYRDSLDLLEARAWVEDGTARDGMIPKLNGAIEALEGGCPWVGIGQLSLASVSGLRGTGIPRPFPAQGGPRSSPRPKRGLPSLFSPARTGSEGV